MSSLTETCRLLGVNPSEYLKAVLTRLPATADADMKNLIPGSWAKSRPPTVWQAA